MSVRWPLDLPSVQLLGLLVAEPLAAVGADEQPVLPRRRGRPSGVVPQGVDLLDPRVEEQQQRRRSTSTRTSSARAPQPRPRRDRRVGSPACRSNGGGGCAPRRAGRPGRSTWVGRCGAPLGAVAGRTGPTAGRAARRLARPAVGPVPRSAHRHDRTLAAHDRSRTARRQAHQRRAQHAEPHHDRPGHQPARHRARRRGDEAGRRRRRRGRPRHSGGPAVTASMDEMDFLRRCGSATWCTPRRR